jgi:hypothetical protein
MSVTGKTEVAELVLEKGIIFGTNAEPKQSIYEQSIDAQYLLGTKLQYSDGREYRYARAGAVALVKSLMTQGAVADADLNAEDQTANFPVVGDTTITVEIGTGVALAGGIDALAGGTLTVNAGSDVGSIYYITGSHIGTTDTNMSLTIDSPIRTTWTTSSNITLMQNLWYDTLVFATTTVSMATGVPLIAVDINYYYWSQTKGPCAIICDATESIAIGGKVGAPASMGTAGQVGLAVTVVSQWGWAMSAETTSAQAIPVWLDLY